MSHYAKGKVDVNCSIEIMRAAIIQTFPEWDKYLDVDPTAGLTIRNRFGGTQAGVSIRVRQMPNGKGTESGEVGFTRKADGKWECIQDIYGVKDAAFKDCGKKVVGSVAKLKVEAILRQLHAEQMNARTTPHGTVIEAVIETESTARSMQ